MKVKPTPTSPKAQLSSSEDLEKLYHDPGMQQIAKPPRAPRLSPATLFFSLIIGFVAGIIGELVFNAYLLDSGSPLENFLQQTTGSQRTTVRSRSADQISKAIDSVNKALLALYPLRPAGTPVEMAYPSSEQKGTALLLTDDGWAVTTRAVLGGEGSFAAVTADRKVLEVKHQLFDPASSLVFFQIDGGNFPVVSFSSSEPAMSESLYALAASGKQLNSRLREVIVEEFDVHPGEETLESSDVVSRFFSLDSELPAAFRGGALSDQRGGVTGIILDSDVDGRQIAISAQMVSVILDGLLRNGAVERPSLGIRYLDLGSTPGIPATVRFQRNDGALVTGTEDAPAVTVGSPAEGAGIQSGDVIFRVDNQNLTEQKGLGATILSYDPGTVVTLQLLRDGKEQSIRVTLGERVAEGE